MKTRNSEVLADFVQYCTTHPDERFWQALRNWSGYMAVGVTDTFSFDKGGYVDHRDTFYWEGRNDRDEKES